MPDQEDPNEAAVPRDRRRRRVIVVMVGAVVVAAAGIVVGLVATASGPSHGTLQTYAKAAPLPSTHAPTVLHAFHQSGPLLDGQLVTNLDKGVTAYRLTDGARTWRFRRGSTEAADLVTGSHQVFVYWADGIVTALRADGHFEWQARSPLARPDKYSDDAINIRWSGKYVLLDGNNQLGGVDAPGPATNWHHKLGDKCTVLFAMLQPASAVIDRDCDTANQPVTGEPLFGVDLASGHRLWQHAGDLTDAVHADATRYADVDGQTSRLHLIDARTGQVNASYPVPAAAEPLADCGGGTVVLGNQFVNPVFGSPELVGFDIATRSIAWKLPFPRNLLAARCTDKHLFVLQNDVRGTQLLPTATLCRYSALTGARQACTSFRPTGNLSARDVGRLTISYLDDSTLMVSGGLAGSLDYPGTVLAGGG